MERRLEIDALRGLMLVWMTLVHIPTLLTPWINQPFGFLSASEGFIFVSALFTGRIYQRILSRDGPWPMQRKLLQRTARLYCFHVVLLVLLFTVAAAIARSGRAPALSHLLSYFFSVTPMRALRDGLLLLYRPPLLDIIPLYVSFLFLSPLLLLIGGRRAQRWKYLLAVSFAIWIAAQFGLSRWVYAALAQYCHVRVPLNEMGAFNLWAWQLMWTFGMWCGVRWARGDLPAERWAERAWIPGLGIALLLLLARYAEIIQTQITGIDPGPVALIDKWHLGVVRLVDFAAVAAVVVRFHRVLEPLAVRPLVLLGQSSLYVFCAHFVFCFAGLAISGNADHVLGWQQFALLAVTFACLLGVAKLFARSELINTHRLPQIPSAAMQRALHTPPRDGLAP
ncbi:MAG TPA: OpgC domain-containing protein [Steroidobacteraceae bacterium]|nr:OpgC domain-containing protein [Steroidobacteraceae bacterium]